MCCRRPTRRAFKTPGVLPSTTTSLLTASARRDGRQRKRRSVGHGWRRSRTGRSAVEHRPYKAVHRRRASGRSPKFSRGYPRANLPNPTGESARNAERPALHYTNDWEREVLIPLCPGFYMVAPGRWTRRRSTWPRWWPRVHSGFCWPCRGPWRDGHGLRPLDRACARTERVSSSA